MGWSYTPESMRVKRLYDTAEYDFLVKRARECILWRMTPTQWDALTDIEYLAWHEAWREIVKEKEA